MVVQAFSLYEPTEHGRPARAKSTAAKWHKGHNMGRGGAKSLHR